MRNLSSEHLQMILASSCIAEDADFAATAHSYSLRSLFDST